MSAEHVPCPSGTTQYTVKSGDTFFTIAKRFGVSLDALVRANPQIPDPSRISVGERICVPTGGGGGGGQGKCPPGSNAYTVRSGDTFFTIAKRFGVSLDALVKANRQIPDPSRITPGMVVCIPQR